MNLRVGIFEVQSGRPWTGRLLSCPGSSSPQMPNELTGDGEWSWKPFSRRAERPPGRGFTENNKTSAERVM